MTGEHPSPGLPWFGITSTMIVITTSRQTNFLECLIIQGSKLMPLRQHLPPHRPNPPSIRPLMVPPPIQRPLPRPSTISTYHRPALIAYLNGPISESRSSGRLDLVGCTDDTATSYSNVLAGPSGKGSIEVYGIYYCSLFDWKRSYCVCVCVRNRIGGGVSR